MQLWTQQLPGWDQQADVFLRVAAAPAPSMSLAESFIYTLVW